ncbi:MAG: hypothetical protein AAGD43_00375 [Pseudomonadota bacterium]
MKVYATFDDIPTELNAADSLIIREVFVRRAWDSIIPNAATDRIQNNALETMIIPHGPSDPGIESHLRHDFSCKLQVLRNKFIFAYLMIFHCGHL